MSKEQVGCARPTGAKVGEAETATQQSQEIVKENSRMSEVRVGAKAPDFVAPAYYQGGFTNVKLSDFLGKWVLLCFYPGDFTFV